MRPACSAIAVNGFSVCRPISQPPAAAAISAITTPSDIARTISACCACSASSGAMHRRAYSGDRRDRPPAQHPELAGRRRNRDWRRRSRSSGGSDAALQRHAPHLEHAAVRSRQHQRAVRHDDFDAGFRGGALEASAPRRTRSASPLRASPWCARGRRPGAAAPAATARTIRRRRPSPGSTTTTLLYQSVRRARMDSVMNRETACGDAAPACSPRRAAW